MVVGSPTMLNLIPSGVMPVVYISQGDAGYDKEFLIYNGDAPYNVPAGVSATIRGTKADGYGVTETAALTAGSNLATVTITEQMVAAEGTNVYELVFVDTNGLRVASINMIWAVKKDALGDSVISESDLDYASQVLNQLQNIQAYKNQLDANTTDIAAETAARITADDTLQANINKEATTRSDHDVLLQAQIDQLIAPTGTAPSAAEVENARVGFTGYTYTTLGDAVRDQVTRLNDQLKYNSYDALKTFATYTSRTVNGVTFTWDADNTVCHAVGTATGLAVTNLYNDTSAMPYGMVKGETYTVKCTTTDENLLLELTNFYEDSTSAAIFITSDTEYTVPENVTRISLRIRVRNSTTVDATIQLAIINTLSNKEIADQLKTQAQDVKASLALAERNETYFDGVSVLNGLVNPYNLFDKSHTETGYTDGWILNSMIDRSSGEVVSTTENVGVTYAIPVLDKKTINAKYGSGQIPLVMRRIAAYDVNGNFIAISGLSVYEYELPKGTYYVRIEHAYGSDTSRLSNHITVTDDDTAGTPYQEYFKPYSKHSYDLNLMQIFPKYTTIGDSLMGGFMNRDGVSVSTANARAAGNNWVNYIALRIGRTFTNLAVGGSTAKQWRESLLVDANIETDCYLIGVGVNDCRQSLPIGTSEDIAPERANNQDTFYGNYDYIVRQLMVWMPKAHIFCFTIPEIEGGNSADYNVAIRYVASEYVDKVHLIDLARNYTEYYKAPIVTDNYSNNHFDPVAYNYMSSIIEKAINDYIEANYNYFATAPYA